MNDATLLKEILELGGSKEDIELLGDIESDEECLEFGDDTSCGKVFIYSARVTLMY